MDAKALNAEREDVPDDARGAERDPEGVLRAGHGESRSRTRRARRRSRWRCGALAWAFVPVTAAYWPVWVAYAFVTGTAATGCWVAAHECGHGAFSDDKTIQDAVGYALHSLLLVPYFSWQRSHAVHHSRTNHVLEGETHVPARLGTEDANVVFKLRGLLGEGPFTFLNLVGVFALGWPIYLLTGASGGPVRGNTNHFLPFMGEQG